MNETIDTAVTTPDGSENIENTTAQAESANATPQADDSAQPTETNNVDNETQPQGAQATEPTEFKFPVQFNHEIRELSLDETTNAVQKGLYADQIIGKLSVLAAASNAKSVGEFVDTMLSAHEDSVKSRYAEQCGGDEELAEKLIKADREQWIGGGKEMSKAWNDDIKQQSGDINKRLAEQFIELQSEIGDIKAFDELPKSVVNTAISKNISLLDAYLRYQHEENKKTAAANTQQAAAKKASAGSLHASTADDSDPALAAALGGIFG